MIDYVKLISNIPNLKNGDLVVTNSYYFASSLLSTQNLIYIDRFKDLNGVKPDWIIALDDVEYSFDHEVEKGICCLQTSLDFLTAPKLKYWYEELGLYVYKILIMDDNDEKYKYFVIFKCRCCTRCRFRNNACCPSSSENVEEHSHSYSSEKNEIFDFVNFIL